MTIQPRELQAHKSWTTTLLCAALAGLAALAGCTEGTAQYTRLGEWAHSDEKPTILSSTPARDAAAYADSREKLTEADWRVLEQFGPRPIWERLADVKRKVSGQKQDATAADESIKAGDAQTAQVLPDVPTVELPDGKVKMFYRFRHLAGVSVSSAYDGGTRRRKVTAAAPNLAPLAEVVNQHLAGKGTATIVPDENMLVITCEATARDLVRQVLSQLDAPPRQVEIRARIFEVSSDFDFQYGAQTLIKHLSGDNKQALASAFSAKAFAGAATDPLNGTLPDPGSAMRVVQLFEKAGLSFDATFQALVDTGMIKLVASPRMTVSAGKTGYMLAGRELPIQSAKIAGDNFVTQSVSYKPIGVQLYITPQTIGVDSVKLHVVTSVSAISGFDPLPSLSGPMASEALVNPIIDSREAETYVTIPDASTLVISGLRMTRATTRERKVPGLGDIAVLGWLFKSHRSQKRVNDLYFFVTPRIMR